MNQHLVAAAFVALLTAGAGTAASAAPNDWHNPNQRAAAEQRGDWQQHQADVAARQRRHALVDQRRDWRQHQNALAKQRRDLVEQQRRAALAEQRRDRHQRTLAAAELRRDRHEQRHSSRDGDGR
jgi:hypothetical protein